MDLDGCVRLVQAFWGLVRADLTAGNRRALDWLDTPEFERWARLSAESVGADEIRRSLRDIYGSGIPYPPTNRYYALRVDRGWVDGR